MPTGSAAGRRPTIRPAIANRAAKAWPTPGLPIERATMLQIVATPIEMPPPGAIRNSENPMVNRSRTIAIGDIHGCDAALAALVAAIAPQPNDTLVVLGDFVDRGPNTRGVIDQLIELSQRCRLVTLLGNHEEM